MKSCSFARGMFSSNVRILGAVEILWGGKYFTTSFINEMFIQQEERC